MSLYCTLPNVQAQAVTSQFMMQALLAAWLHEKRYNESDRKQGEREPEAMLASDSPRIQFLPLFPPSHDINLCTLFEG